MLDTNATNVAKVLEPIWEALDEEATYPVDTAKMLQLVETAGRKIDRKALDYRLSTGALAYPEKTIRRSLPMGSG